MELHPCGCDLPDSSGSDIFDEGIPGSSLPAVISKIKSMPCVGREDLTLVTVPITVDLDTTVGKTCCTRGLQWRNNP